MTIEQKIEAVESLLKNSGKLSVFQELAERLELKANERQIAKKAYWEGVLQKLQYQSAQEGSKEAEIATPENGQDQAPENTKKKSPKKLSD